MCHYVIRHKKASLQPLMMNQHLTVKHPAEISSCLLMIPTEEMGESSSPAEVPQSSLDSWWCRFLPETYIQCWTYKLSLAHGPGRKEWTSFVLFQFQSICSTSEQHPDGARWEQRLEMTCNVFTAWWWPPLGLQDLWSSRIVGCQTQSTEETSQEAQIQWSGNYEDNVSQFMLLGEGKKSKINK